MRLIDNPKNIITPIALIIVVYLLNDTLVDLVVWLFHTLFILMHTLIEFSEHALDILIEHLFHTDPRTTEIIVFYIMLLAGVGVTLKLMWVLSHWFSTFIEQQIDFWHQEKNKMISTWQAHSVIKKLKCSACLTISLFICILWLLN
ncbi:MAG: hypothetical protein HOP23_06650 [Methylococcaceae bacterium]|nr:hypothetical protein [Methylococcaceae bacterium]